MKREVGGILKFGPSPCLEVPCMPGTAFTLDAWYLKGNGRLLDWGDEFGGTRLKEGMRVKVAGAEAILTDIYGFEHKVLEVERLDIL